MKRTVKLFGRAIPIWVLLTALVVVSASAWALISLASFDVSGTAGTADTPRYHFAAPTYCQAVSAPNGDGKGVWNCTLDPQAGIVASVSGITDESVGYMMANIYSDDTRTFNVCLDSFTPAAYVQLVGFDGFDGSLTVAPGTNAAVSVMNHFAGLAPAQVVDYSVGLTIQLDPCP